MGLPAALHPQHHRRHHQPGQQLPVAAPRKRRQAGVTVSLEQTHRHTHSQVLACHITNVQGFWVFQLLYRITFVMDMQFLV